MSERKEGNPKDAIGVTKVPFSTIPQQVLGEVGLALLEGALKYGRFNWRAMGVRYTVYRDAMQRHMADFEEGQDIDPDSGLSHVTKAIACLTVLRDSMMMGNWVDDRPPRVPNSETWIKALNAKAKALIEKYPNPPAAYTEVGMAAETAQPTYSEVEYDPRASRWYFYCDGEVEGPFETEADARECRDILMNNAKAAPK